MNSPIELFKDFNFLIGIILFISSVLGIVWILKSLQSQSESESHETKLENLGQNVSAQPDMPQPAAISKNGVQNLENITIETLSEQLLRIEETLNKIAAKLDQPGGQKSETSAELRAVVQALKSNPVMSDPDQIQQLSSKIDKIYQVLTSLSGTE